MVGRILRFTPMWINTWNIISNIEPINTEVNISSAIEVKIPKLIDLIEEITSKKILTTFKELREIDIRRSVLDNSLIKSLTNWEPVIELEKGIDQFINNDSTFENRFCK